MMLDLFVVALYAVGMLGLGCTLAFTVRRRFARARGGSLVAGIVVAVVVPIALYNAYYPLMGPHASKVDSSTFVEVGVAALVGALLLVVFAVVTRERT